MAGVRAGWTGGRLSAGLFAAVRDYAYRKAGIELVEGKQEMVAARLWRRVRVLGFESVEAYWEAVRRDRTGGMEADLLDALATNHTGFFREPAHFEFLRRRIVPDLRERGAFTIWSAACSSGEEPYSIAVALVEEMGEAALTRARVRASDLSGRALGVGRAGIYPAERFENWSAAWRRRYLLRGKNGQAGRCRMRPEIRRMVDFERVNLMDPLGPEGPYPLILLRNVMIYFDRAGQERVVAAVTGKLEPGGYLFIGHSESLNGVRHELEAVEAAVYRKPVGGRA
jgi:chemotaxis protein methyltransferase CheR